MNANQIADYVRANGRVTRIVEDVGDAENGPDLKCSGDFKRLGPLSLFEDSDSMILTCNVPRSESCVLTLVDTYKLQPF